MLWIAFKNYYLRDEGQQFWKTPAGRECCELLSKIIIFVMKDNLITGTPFSLKVVNCFQKLLSSWWRTTTESAINQLGLLWIAFKNYYLRDEGQLCNLFNIGHTVVNCFQKLLSSWWRTTQQQFFYEELQLWIAFKNYYLRDEGQLKKDGDIRMNGCELLSKIIIFVMKDNLKK